MVPKKRVRLSFIIVVVVIITLVYLLGRNTEFNARAPMEQSQPAEPLPQTPNVNPPPPPEVTAPPAAEAPPEVAAPPSMPLRGPKRDLRREERRAEERRVEEEVEQRDHRQEESRGDEIERREEPVPQEEAVPPPAPVPRGPTFDFGDEERREELPTMRRKPPKGPGGALPGGPREK
jgi:hypothetical protein